MIWNDQKEIRYLQLARDAAMVQRRNGNTQMATHIEAAASSWVFSMRDLSEVMHKVEERMKLDEII